MISNFKASQVGRSLIEMLAVLTIIGIISVGALLGFSHAMNKHYANETMEEINQRLRTYLPQFDRGIKTFSNGSFGNTTYYNYRISAENKNNKLVISLYDVPVVICRNLLPISSTFKVSINKTEFSGNTDICEENLAGPGISETIEFISE